MLYIFAGFPGKDSPSDSLQLHAGGVEYCVETVRELAILEHELGIQYRKEGVFQVEGDRAEWLRSLNYRVSDLCLRDGIAWDWFQENWSFGNGLTTHKTLASPEYRTVVHGTNQSLDEFLPAPGPTKLAELELFRDQQVTEDWEKYEARWLPGTCPEENHAVHLTWLDTTHRLPRFAYGRIKQLIEGGAEPSNRPLYSTEPGKHFSNIRTYDGRPAYGGTHALPMS